MGYKVLLADDSITIQKVIGIIFANEEYYDLTVVDNGNAALEKAKEIHPDVIMLDALMPGKSGYEVCREVRQDDSLKDIPVLLLVGAFEPFDEEKARNSGADDHISKPFESQALIEKVKKLIELGEERAKTRVQAVGVMPAAMPSDILSLGGEAEPALEAVTGPVVAAGQSAVVVENPAEVASSASLEIEEASPEDDLWGVFEIEEVFEGEDVQLGEIIEEDEPKPEVVDTVEEIEPFVFKEDDQVLSGGEATISLGEYPDTVAATTSETEDSFVLKAEPGLEDFGRTEPAVEPSIGAFEPVAPASAFEFAEESPEAPGLAAISSSEIQTTAPASVAETSYPFGGQELQIAPQEEIVPVAEVPGHKEEIAPATVSESAGTGTISLTEEQLAGMLSNISRDIIEKIAWEVVPDLAETIIREEIRKIKEGR